MSYDGGQPRLYDPNRYSSARVMVLLNLPASNARSFLVASALGRFIRHDGSSERLKSAKEAACSLIKRDRLQVVLDALDLSQRRWQQLVTDWVSRYLAHRCDDGGVCLFTVPLLDACPHCRAEIAVDHSPPTTRPGRGTGFAPEQAKESKPQGEASLRLRRTCPSPGSAQALRSSGTDAPHRPDGLNEGIGVGLQVLAHEEASDPICTCGHEPSLHFSTGGCRRIGCACGEVAG